MSAYRDLADKIDLHRTIDASPGFHLSELEIHTIVEGLRYAADWEEAIKAVSDGG